MPQSEAEAGHDFPAEYLHNGLGEVLRDDTSNAKNTGTDDGLLTPKSVRNEAGRERRDEETDFRCCVEDLLISGTDDPFAVDLLAKFLKEGRDSKQVTNSAGLVAKVHRQEEDQEALMRA